MAFSKDVFGRRVEIPGLGHFDLPVGAEWPDDDDGNDDRQPERPADAGAGPTEPVERPKG